MMIICRPLVGIIYNKADNPAMGSLLYCIFVFINSNLLVWASKESDIKAFIIRFIIVLILEVIIVNKISCFKIESSY